ncbi:hypothetical protein LARV_02681 [Longilinea arvoryzae]|uniref:Uncharacterized protein n=1 Tax=Longilinea arvoryzae TaxID=360412 RepID=A0A0S7BK75_9CHLR|nr:hypothetical protein [Longilinea arvoryzae]GAP14902.1 hypothetical protein LARV_02681 [Longilinea arvoryzae]
MRNATAEQIDIFNRWLSEELAMRGWSDFELSRRAKITHAVLSHARMGTLPKWEACVAIAAALGMPAEVVFRKAGLLPSDPREDLVKAEMDALYGEASKETRLEILRYVRYLVRFCK